MEAVAAFFGLLCVGLTIRQNLWCWPAGLVQVILFAIIFYQVRLYSDLILHLIYIPMQIYGWYHWRRGGRDRSSVRVSRLGAGGWLGWSLLTLGGSLGWGHFMATHTEAALPYGDAFTTVASLVAQWLLARKKLESWLFWIAVDLTAIGIYWTKALWLTSALYAVFLGLAILGLFTWHAAGKPFRECPAT